MDIGLMVIASMAFYDIVNTAHNIDHIEFIYIGGERVRVDYGVPKFWGDRDSDYCGFASYDYTPIIFVNTACEDNSQTLKHEVKHIEQYQWYYHPPANETRRPFKEYLYQFEVEAYKAQDK